MRTWLRKTGNVIAAALYFFAAHLYDGLCFAVSSIFSYPEALCIMTAVLLSASIILLFLHETLGERFQWDILGMNEISRTAYADSIPKHKYFRRLMRWTLSKGHRWFFIIGSVTVGPPVVTLLLQEKNNWKSRWFYLVAGTLISVTVWVSIWSGIKNCI